MHWWLLEYQLWMVWSKLQILHLQDPWNCVSGNHSNGRGDEVKNTEGKTYPNSTTRRALVVQAKFKVVAGASLTVKCSHLVRQQNELTRHLQNCSVKELAPFPQAKTNNKRCECYVDIIREMQIYSWLKLGEIWEMMLVCNVLSRNPYSLLSMEESGHRFVENGELLIGWELAAGLA